MLKSLQKFNTDDWILLNQFITFSRAYIKPFYHSSFEADKILTVNNVDIYLGSHDSALCVEDMMNNNIKNVLSLVNVNEDYPHLFNYKILDYRDSKNENLFKNLYEGVSFIYESVRKGENILIHCFYGKSRSTSFLIAYMIKYLKYNYEDALKTIRTFRNIALPNSNFESQLRFYETLCQDLNKSWVLITDKGEEVICSYCNKGIDFRNSILYKGDICHEDCIPPKNIYDLYYQYHIKNSK